MSPSDRRDRALPLQFLRLPEGVRMCAGLCMHVVNFHHALLCRDLLLTPCHPIVHSVNRQNQRSAFQSRSSASRTAALDGALCDPNNADGCGAWGHMYFRTHQAPRLYAELDRERCGRYVIQFRSCSAWRLALRRAPALELSSHEPTQWDTAINRLNWPLQKAC